MDPGQNDHLTFWDPEMDPFREACWRELLILRREPLSFPPGPLLAPKPLPSMAGSFLPRLPKGELHSDVFPVGIVQSQQMVKFRRCSVPRWMSLLVRNLSDPSHVNQEYEAKTGIKLCFYPLR